MDYAALALPREFQDPKTNEKYPFQMHATMFNV